MLLNDVICCHLIPHPDYGVLFLPDQKRKFELQKLKISGGAHQHQSTEQQYQSQACIHARMYTCTNVRINVHMYVHMYVCMNKCTHVCIHVYTVKYTTVYSMTLPVDIFSRLITLWGRASETQRQVGLSPFYLSLKITICQAGG